MANVLNPAQQNLLAAAAGNPVLLELLESMLNTVQATQQVTNTTGKNVPAQVQAAVSFLQGNYIVEITNPGAAAPLSQIQRAQQTRNANQATTLQPVTPILHQIRCATSPAFAVNDNVQTFGGDTGSSQTYWTLGSLGAGNFYFQVRSSYDGVNWNQWKNANGGQSVTSFPSEVTLEQQTNSEWGLFTLPGNQLVAVGEGFVADQGTFTLPENLFSSAMVAIAGPNGFIDAGLHMNDIPNCDVTIDTPANTSGTVGIPDYPIRVIMKYGDASTPQNLWTGSANIFAIAYDPSGTNVTQYPAPAGTPGFWVVFKLPGGAQLAIGRGQAAHGTGIWVPAALQSWITGGGNMISVCSPHGNESGSNDAHGILKCQLSGLTAEMQYEDGAGNIWAGSANWLAIAVTPGFPVTATTGGQFFVIDLAHGQSIAFGGGQVAAGSAFALPAGFSSDKMLAIATPGGFTDTGHPAHGVSQCDIIGATPVLAYRDGSGNSWTGPSNWLAFCWKSAA